MKQQRKFALHDIFMSERNTRTGKRAKVQPKPNLAYQLAYHTAVRLCELQKLQELSGDTDAF
jgi:hypothetical protein